MHPTQGQSRLVLGPQVLAFPVVEEEGVQEARLRLLLARQEQMVERADMARQAVADTVRREEEAAQETPAVVLAGTPMDKAE